MTLTPAGATERPSAAEMLELENSIRLGHVRVVHLDEFTTWQPYKTEVVTFALREASSPDSKLEAYRKALEDEIKIIEERYGGRRKFLENSLHGDAMQWRRLTNVLALAAGG